MMQKCEVAGCPQWTLSAESRCYYHDKQSLPMVQPHRGIVPTSVDEKLDLCDLIGRLSRRSSSTAGASC